MSKILDTNDILGALHDTNHPRFKQHREAIETAVRLAAMDLANEMDIVCTKVDTQLGFGGLCAHMRPKTEGQQWPAILNPYDPDGDFQ